MLQNLDNGRAVYQISNPISAVPIYHIKIKFTKGIEMLDSYPETLDFILVSILISKIK